MKNLFILIILGFTTMTTLAQLPDKFPMRVAVAGTTHGHVSWILGRKNKSDIQIVGVYETNKELVNAQAVRYGFDTKLIYNDLRKMLAEVKPEAVLAFGSIHEHLAVVEACAPLGIHVMVEKPLAINNEEANKMESLARKYKIHLLTNYETSWYRTTEFSYQFLNDSNSIGKLRKAVFHHGHQGPKEIGVSKEFFQWLTDPVQNGGGALIDFGCYGANIMTYLAKGAKPISVTATTRQFKPAIYPRVDDEATIIVDYPGYQGIIQASWNWPFGRKDMEIYGDSGYIISKNSTDILIRNSNHKEEISRRLTDQEVKVYTDPFVYLLDVIRGRIQVRTHDLYSLENNMMVVKILDAARESALTGKKVTIQ